MYELREQNVSSGGKWLEMRLLRNSLSESKKPSSKRPPVDVSPHKKNKSLIIVGVVFPIMALLLGLIFFKGNESPKQPYSPTSPAASQSKPEDGFPGGWTQELYEGVVVATKNYDADNEKYSFENGSNFEELEKQVGKPDTVTSWEKEDYGMPPEPVLRGTNQKLGSTQAIPSRSLITKTQE